MVLEIITRKSNGERLYPKGEGKMSNGDQVKVLEPAGDASLLIVYQQEFERDFDVEIVRT